MTHLKIPTTQHLPAHLTSALHGALRLELHMAEAARPPVVADGDAHPRHRPAHGEEAGQLLVRRTIVHVAARMSPPTKPHGLSFRAPRGGTRGVAVLILRRTDFEAELMESCVVTVWKTKQLKKRRFLGITRRESCSL
jgi:hypothetical protein